MARPQARAPQRVSTPAEAPTAATWADWFGQFQSFQVHAAHDMLAAYNRWLAALASSRDAQAVGAAFQATLGDWMACADSVQHEWLALSKAVPEDALAALGWRLRPGARSARDAGAHEGAPDLFEQSRLGVEMLMRPWMPAPDLDHTDEFVA